MKYIEKLLQGVEVEWKKLGEVAEIKRGRRLVRRELSETGRYAVFQNSMTPLGFYDESNVCGDTTFIISAGAAGEIGYSSMDFWAADDIYYFILTTDLCNKYLYYFLLTKQQAIKGQVRYASVPRLAKSSFERVPIPIPPLHVQQEIVRILDKFTELETELEAKLETELELRKQQYERYRDQLLAPDKGLSETEVEWMKLGEVAEYSSRRVNAIALSKHNYIGVDNLLQNKAGKKDSNYVPTDGNFTAYTIGDVLIGNIRPYLKKIWLANQDGGTNGDVLVIHTTDKSVDAEYLYQVLADDKFFVYNMQYAKGAKMPRGSKQKIMDYLIPIPPLSEQQRIVSVLDKFHTLTTSISEGLPKEIELRKQQYAYYRDQLLSFER